MTIAAPGISLFSPTYVSIILSMDSSTLFICIPEGTLDVFIANVDIGNINNPMIERKNSQIGRASCRERAKGSAAARGVEKKKWNSGQHRERSERRTGWTVRDNDG